MVSWFGTSAPRSIFFIGNSHTSELAMALICGLHQLGMVESFRGTNQTSGCLTNFKVGENCDHLGTCGMQLSTVKLKNGGSIYLAYNHPWLYDGMSGLNHVLNHMKVNISALDAVLIGSFNGLWWLHEMYPGPHAYVRPTFNSSCGAVLHKKHILLESSMIQKYLEVFGFTGLLIGGGMFGSKISEIHFDESLQPFKFSYLNFTNSSCSVPKCGPVLVHDHVCVPGYPLLLATDILTAIREISEI